VGAAVGQVTVGQVTVDHDQLDPGRVGRHHSLLRVLVAAFQDQQVSRAARLQRPNWLASPAMLAAVLVTISASCRGGSGWPWRARVRSATFSSASRLVLPLGSQSAPSPTGIPSCSASAAGWSAVQPQVALGGPDQVGAGVFDLAELLVVSAVPWISMVAGVSPW
jgi:hypothetical protein